MSAIDRALARLRAAGLAGASLPAERSSLACSCGCTEAHVIARRQTADGRHLAIWSTGEITYAIGLYLRGLGTPRSRWGVETRIKAVRLMMDDFGAYDADEIPTLIRAAEGTYAHDYSSETDRRIHAHAIARRTLARRAA